MKNLSLFIALIVVCFFSCGEEERFEIISTEAFAYSLESSWELNASVNVIGFHQEEDENGRFSARLSYSFHLVTPESDTLFEADYGYIDRQEDEELIDIQIESQLEIDSSYIPGLYKIIYEITDDYNQQTISADADFELTAE